MKSFCFRIRKEYFDAIMKGEKTVEYRRNSDFWRIRVANSLSFPVKLMIGLGGISWPVDAIGVFICGKRIHRRKIKKISKIRTPDDFSDQGKKDVNTKFCFAFHLGDVIE